MSLIEYKVHRVGMFTNLATKRGRSWLTGAGFSTYAEQFFTKNRNKHLVAIRVLVGVERKDYSLRVFNCVL